VVAFHLGLPVAGETIEDLPGAVVLGGQAGSWIAVWT
jgi:hypothetical protein